MHLPLYALSSVKSITIAVLLGAVTLALIPHLVHNKDLINI